MTQSGAIELFIPEEWQHVAIMAVRNLCGHVYTHTGVRIDHAYPLLLRTVLLSLECQQMAKEAKE